MKNIYTIGELESLVFEKNQATKQNKDKLFKIAKANDDIETIEKLRDELKFKSAKMYMDKLNNFTIENVFQNLNLAGIKRLCSQGIAINKIQKDGANLLHFAAEQDNIELIEYLIENNANLDLKDTNTGATALLLASQNNNYRAVKILLEHNANVNIQADLEDTALIVASAKNNVDVIKILLEYKANMDIQSRTGLYSLLIAAQNNHKDTVEILLSHNANPNLRAKENGYTSLHMPTYRGYGKIVKMLLSAGANPNVQDNDGDTPLLLAAREGHNNIVKILINENADLDIKNNNGDTALALASYRNHQEIAKLLLETQANPNIQAKDGSTALSFALKNNNKELITLLIKSGAYKLPILDKMNEMWDSICAQGNEATELVEILIKNGADINFRSSNGNTPLITAANYGHLEIVETLINNGAKLNCQNVVGITALYISTMNKFINIAKVLLEAGANANIQDSQDKATPLGRIILDRMNKYDITATTLFIKEKNDINVKIVKLLLKHKADPNILNINDSSALLIASRIGDLEMVELLLNAKARMDIQENTGLTALMGAVHANHLEVCKILLEYGADVNYTSATNESTALSAAIENNNLEIVKLLILEGADPYQESMGSTNSTPFGVHPNDIRHGNALQLAQEFGFSEIEYFLKNHMKTIEKEHEIPIGHIKLENNLSLDVYSDYIILKSKIGDMKSETKYNKIDKNKYKNGKKGYFNISSSIVKKETIAGDTREYKIESYTGNVLELEENIHDPKRLLEILNLFTEENPIKYTAHSFEWSRYKSYNNFIKEVENAFSEVKNDLRILSPDLYNKINKFLFDSTLCDDNTWGIHKIDFGWSSPELKEWCSIEDSKANGKKAIAFNLPVQYQKEINGNTVTTFEEICSVFKNEIEIRDDDKLKILFATIKKDVLKFDFEVVYKNLEAISFYTDVENFKNGLTLIFEQFKEDGREKYDTIEIEAIPNESENYVDIRIMQIGSTVEKKSYEMEKETENGHFQDIKNHFSSLCDWSIEASFGDGDFRVNYLLSDENSIKPISLKKKPLGFTHILRFYK